MWVPPDTHLPRAGHDLCIFPKHTPPPLIGELLRLMPTAKFRASTILSEFAQAQTELVGKAVILTDGKAGTVENIWLDEFHGLRISIQGHDGKWPISTIKFAQTGQTQEPELRYRAGPPNKARLTLSAFQH
jgi:hypothetical protein